MTQHSSNADASQETRQLDRAALPAWMEPPVRVCTAVYGYLLVIAGLILLGALIVIAIGLVEFPLRELALTVLAYAATLGYLCAVVGLNRATLVPGWAGFGASIALHFGAPFLLVFLAQNGGLTPEHPFVLAIGRTLAGLATYLTIVSVLDLLALYGLRFLAWRDRRRRLRIHYVDLSAADVSKRGLVPKCWQTSHCRAGVRGVCPNFVDRVPCWRRRSGCVCDGELSTYLMDAANARADEDAGEGAQRGVGPKPSIGRLREHLRARRRRRWRLQKLACHECPVFVEHQEYKYARLSWISFPATLAIVGGLYPYFHQGYQWAGSSLEAWARGLYLEGRLPAAFSPDTSVPLTQSYGFELFVLAVLALFVLSYMITLVDTLFLSWKL